MVFLSKKKKSLLAEASASDLGVSDPYSSSQKSIAKVGKGCWGDEDIILKCSANIGC